MNKLVAHVLFVLVMAAVIIAADVLFVRHRFWYRLAANVGMVLVAIAFYLRFLK